MLLLIILSRFRQLNKNKEPITLDFIGLLALFLFLKMLYGGFIPKIFLKFFSIPLVGSIYGRAVTLDKLYLKQLVSWNPHM